MFRLAAIPTMKRTVTVRAPDPEIADKIVEQTFTAHYRVLTNSEMKAFDAGRAKLSPEEQAADPYALQKLVLVGWGEDVVGDDGKPVPFSKEALERALDFPWFATSVREEFLNGMAGAPRLGN